MNNYIKYYLLVLSIFVFTMNMQSQDRDSLKLNQKGREFFVDIFLGTQVSGIRKEDYVSSNFAPYMKISIGKWIVPYLALSINYQGPYYNFISDNYRHYFTYIDGEVIIRTRRIINSKWNLNFILGSGLFFNNYNSRINICATSAINIDYLLVNRISLKANIGSIFGWGIYQEDKDIIPNFSIGISYSL